MEINMTTEHKAMTTLKVNAPFEYFSPRWKELTQEEKEVRDVSYSLKELDSQDVWSAALFLKRLVRAQCVLIPIPTSEGCVKANQSLINEILKHTVGGETLDVFGCRNRKSNRLKAIEGNEPGEPETLGFYLKKGIEELKGKHIYFVDNMVNTGATLRACFDLVGFGEGLCFAVSPRDFVRKEFLGNVEVVNTLEKGEF
jgi:hypothetical protein